MVYAYLRISTGRQHLENQRNEIERYAAGRGIVIDHWVMEVVSGRKGEKERELGKLLRRLRSGDTLVVTEVSRLSRTLHEIMSIVGRCLEKKINIYSTKDGYTFDDSINSKVLCFAFGLVAEIERNLISMRTREALALRRAEGVVLGRRQGSYTKLHILRSNCPQVVRMIREGATIGRICDVYGVGRTTFSRFRKMTPSVDRLLTRRNAAQGSQAGPSTG